MSENVAKAVLVGDTVVVSERSEADFLYQRGYGLMKGGKLYLTLVESAFLVYRGFINVADEEGREVGFREIVDLGSSLDPDFWTVLNVYTDLRNRALVVKPGVERLELLVDWKKKNKTRRMLVRIVKEGSRLGFSVFEDMFRRALESGRELVMAVVDKEGVISYYVVEGVSRVGPEISSDFEVYDEQEG